MNLREAIAIFRRHIALVLLFTITVTGAAVFTVGREAAQYRAFALIRLKNERAALTGSLGDDRFNQVMGRTADPLLSQLEQLRSRTLAQQVVERLGLRLRPLGEALPDGYLTAQSIAADASADTLNLEFGPQSYSVRGAGGISSSPYGLSVLQSGVTLTVRSKPPLRSAKMLVLSEQRAIEQLQRGLRTVPREKTDVVEVSYTSGDPVFAQQVVNATVEEFQRASASTAQEQSRRRRMFLGTQLSKTDSILAENQAALSQFRQREQVFSSRDRLVGEQMILADLRSKRDEILADRRTSTSLLAALEAGSASDSGGLQALLAAPGVVSNPAISQLYQQLVRYEMSRDSLTTGKWASAQSNPDVQRLNTLINNTRRNLISAARSYISTLDARIASLDQTLDRNTKEIQTLPAKEAEEMLLVQHVETAKQLADQLRGEYQKAQIEEAVEVGQVEILDRAATPHSPIGTGKPLKVAFGILAGLMLGTGVAFLREHLDTKLNRVDEIEPQLGIPALAVIPRLFPKQNAWRLPLRREIEDGASNTAGNGVTRPLQALVAVSRSRSGAAEAYRTLRTNLMFSQAVAEIGSVMVTSPFAAEGKTTTAANLAVSFAQQGMRVVLVDCDLRKPRLHRLFDVVREPGLSDVLVGRADLSEAIRKSGVTGLAIITAGTPAPNPAELLGSQRMRQALAQLENQADLVIIDAPPVLVAGDASIISSIAKATIMVVRAGSTDKAVGRASLDQLRTVGANILGAVLNDPDSKVRTGGGYYQYVDSYYGEQD